MGNGAVRVVGDAQVLVGHESPQRSFWAEHKVLARWGPRRRFLGHQGLPWGRKQGPHMSLGNLRLNAPPALERHDEGGRNISLTIT